MSFHAETACTSSDLDVCCLPDSRFQEGCLSRLASQLVTADNAATLAQVGGVDSLVAAVLKFPDDTAIHLHALRLLVRFAAAGPTTVALIGRLGGASALRTALRANLGAPSVLDLALRAATSLAESEEVTVQVIARTYPPCSLPLAWVVVGCVGPGLSFCGVLEFRVFVEFFLMRSFSLTPPPPFFFVCVGHVHR